MMLSRGLVIRDTKVELFCKEEDTELSQRALKQIYYDSMFSVESDPEKLGYYIQCSNGMSFDTEGSVGFNIKEYFDQNRARDEAELALKPVAQYQEIRTKLSIASDLITQILRESPEDILTAEAKNKLFSVRNAIDEANYSHFYKYFNH